MLKLFIKIICICSFIFCVIPQKQPTLSENKQIQYSHAQLIHFLDSIGNLSPSSFTDKNFDYLDSIFMNRQQLNYTLSEQDFAKLKRACKSNSIDTSFAKKIFKDVIIDSISALSDSIQLTFISFDKNIDDFNEFAISPSDSMLGECDLYFFKSSKIIAKHSIYHHYGLEINYFKDSDNNTVVYYKELLGSGSGIWLVNNYFYKYYNSDSLIPVLNITNNANLSYPWNNRSRWLETSIIKTNPLQFKMVYYQYLHDTTIDEEVDENLVKLIDDSTIVEFKWDENSKTFQGNYSNSAINKNQILSYNLDNNDLLFINSYYKTLKQIIAGTDERKKSALFQYLNEVKNF